MVIERGVEEHPERALISGPPSALQELLGTSLKDRFGERIAAAVRQAVNAYLAPRSGRPLVVGVVNVTPDSFSDGGAFSGPDAAIAHGLALAREGAYHEGVLK